MSFLEKLHPELKVDHFSRLDGTIIFFSFVKAAIMRTKAQKVMDFGAGRGQVFYEDTNKDASLFKMQLMDLRTEGSEVWACDVDPVVMTHPASHHQVTIGPDGVLPFEDNMFDVIASDVTLEHVDNPEIVASEIIRVLKPGGYFCARTPNKYGYVSIATRLVPNKHHVAALRKIAPIKQAQDVFPTRFKMNTVGDIKRLFKGCEVVWYRDSAGPSYYFNNSILYRLFLGLHKILPNSLATSLCIFVRKPGG
ncbi:MAG TPA: class I SAM-dependent methyltransferase [Chakrabartia sp.]|nr:class I SAM-dependent methyltransferase [Chakrabartia sp.]